MNLGDLDFKVEDFNGIKMPMTNGRITTDIVRLDEMLRVANGLLKDRLEKTPEVYSHRNCKSAWSNNCERHHTHRARLVCIKEIGK